MIGYLLTYLHYHEKLKNFKIIAIENHSISQLLESQLYLTAEDLGVQRIDLAQLLIKHSQATYFLRASGHSMTEVGIFDGDILVVDRAIKPRNAHIVVAIVDGDFTVKVLSQRGGRIKLKSANPTYPDITPKDGQTIEIWGVVTSTIKQFNV